MLLIKQTIVFMNHCHHYLFPSLFNDSFSTMFCRSGRYYFFCQENEYVNEILLFRGRAICKYQHRNTGIGIGICIGIGIGLPSILHMYNEACKTVTALFLLPTAYVQSTLSTEPKYFSFLKVSSAFCHCKRSQRIKSWLACIWSGTQASHGWDKLKWTRES